MFASVSNQVCTSDNVAKPMDASDEKDLLAWAQSSDEAIALHSRTASTCVAAGSHENVAEEVESLDDPVVLEVPPAIPITPAAWFSQLECILEARSSVGNIANQIFRLARRYTSLPAVPEGHQRILQEMMNTTLEDLRFSRTSIAARLNVSRKALDRRTLLFHVFICSIYNSSQRPHMLQAKRECLRSGGKLERLRLCSSKMLFADFTLNLSEFTFTRTLT